MITKYIKTPYIGIEIQVEKYDDNKTFIFITSCTGEERCYDHIPSMEEITSFRNEVINF